MLIFLQMERHASPRVLSAVNVRAVSGAGLFESLHIRGHGVIYAVTGVPTQEAITRVRTKAVLDGPTRRVRLWARDASVRVTYDGPEGRVDTPDALTDHDVLEWMGAAGVDVDSSDAMVEAREIRQLIAYTVQGYSVTSASTLPSRDQLRSPGITAAGRSIRAGTSRPWVVGVIVSWTLFASLLVVWPLLPRHWRVAPRALAMSAVGTVLANTIPADGLPAAAATRSDHEGL